MIRSSLCLALLLSLAPPAPAQDVYRLSDVVAVVSAPDEHMTVLLASGVTHSASTNLIQISFARNELRINTQSGVSGDGGWTNLPNSTGGSTRSSTIAPVIYTTEWDSGNPRVHHRVTTNCDTYQDLRICAQMHQRAVAAMQAIYPPS